MRKGVLLIVMLFVCMCVHADKETSRTVKVRGEYSVILAQSPITGIQAMELAQQDAKRRAIEQVCGSRLNVWDQVEISQRGETFNSLSVNQVDGEVVEFEVLEQGTEQRADRTQETIFYCVAKVKVKKGIEADPDFTMAVKGIKPVYYEEENLTFSITPYRDCYVKVFLFSDDKTGYRIYPTALETAEKFAANTPVQFPRNHIVDYSITKDTDYDVETNRLVIILTKQERPFYHETTSRQEIERWMAMIPNNEKYVYFASFDIYKR